MISRVKMAKPGTFRCCGCGEIVEKHEGYRKGDVCRRCAEWHAKQDWSIYDNSWGDYDSDPVNPDAY